MAILLAQAQVATVLLGPFVSALDGDTLLPALTITQADTLLSLNGGVCAPKHAPAPATYAQGGYYQVTLDATDTAALGQGKVLVAMPGALVVWLDVVIVSAPAYTRVEGLSVVPLVLRSTPAVVVVGPLIDAVDGVTLRADLALVPSQIQVSKQDGLLLPLHSAAAIVSLGAGLYRVTLDAADTNTPGALQVMVDPGACLPVWLDVSVVTAPVWALFFPPDASPSPAPPPGPVTLPPGPPPRVLPPSQPRARLGRLGRRHFTLAKQRAMIEKHGAMVVVSPKLPCPCRLPERQPDPNCPTCKGTARFYPPSAVYTTMMLLTHATTEYLYQETGELLTGGMQASVLPESTLAHEDKIRLVDIKMVFNGEVLEKDVNDTLRFPHGVDVHLVADRGRVYQPGVDYTLVPPNEIRWLPGGTAPVFAAAYAVRYSAYPVFLVVPQIPRPRVEGRRPQSRVVILDFADKVTVGL
jgi:hypothetical protein